MSTLFIQGCLVGFDAPLANAFHGLLALLSFALLSRDVPGRDCEIRS
jgi:hypothetical protein